MKKTVIAAFAVYLGVALQVQAQTSSTEHITTAPNINGTFTGVTTPATTKLGLLNVSLKNIYQAYQSGSTWGVAAKPNDPRVGRPPGSVSWDNISYTYSDPAAADCQGAITYKSASKTVNNATIIASINKALSWPVGKNYDLVADTTVLGGPLVAAGSPYNGAFTSSAKIVVVNYDNGRYLPPYPPTEDYVGDEATWGDQDVWNAPWEINGRPGLGVNGSIVPLSWPNLNYISWGKLDSSAGSDTWVGARVFIIDPKNLRTNLKCFEVTPFFALEESYCFYCWDTMDRVTDGKVTFGTTSSQPPCAGGSSFCSVAGSGTTRLYWTVKFNNVMGNHIIANVSNTLLSKGAGLGAGSLYYNDILGWPASYGDTFGWKLDDSDYPNSIYAMSFAVSGQATYSWKFKALSDSLTWPVGQYSMSASGHGFSPMCGLFSGSVSMTEYDKNDRQFGGLGCP